MYSCAEARQRLEACPRCMVGRQAVRGGQPARLFVGATQVATALAAYSCMFPGYFPIPSGRAMAHGLSMTPPSTKPGHRALRRGRHSAPGQRYFVTTVCDQRRRRFEHVGAVSVAAEKLQEHALWGDSRVLCWVLMPDHLHALIELGRDRTLSRLMQRVKSVLALAVHEVDGGAGRLWMPGYHDRALRVEEDAPGVARYIIWNPVRAGLVASPHDYPYWSAVWPEVADEIA
jgi:putative transposase